MTDPVRYLGFAQRASSGSWRQYQYRDDLDESRGYWALKSNGQVEYVSALQGAELRFSSGSTDPARRHLADLEQMAGGGGIGANLPGVPLSGGPGVHGITGARSRAAQGSDLSPEMLRAMRIRAAGFGFEGPGVTVENVADIINTAETVMRSLPDPTPERFNAEFAAAMGFVDADGNLAPARVAALYSDTPRTGSSGSGSGGSGGTGPLGAMGPATPDGKPVSGPSTSTGTFAGTAGGGIVGGGMQLPSKPGVGPGGVEVTPNLLKEFVDSDWRLAMNAFVNQFRDAGGASVFLDFLQKKAVEFLGQYEGELAQQALDGKLPTGDFASFLSRRGVNGVGNIGGDPNADATAAFRESQARKAAAAAGQSGRTAAPGTVAPGAVNPPDVPVTPSAGSGINLTPNQDLVREYIG